SSGPPTSTASARACSKTSSRCSWATTASSASRGSSSGSGRRPPFSLIGTLLRLGHVIFLGPQVGIDDLLVGGDVRRGSLGDHPTLRQDHDLVAHHHQHFHVVLDEQDRLALFTQRRDVPQQRLHQRRVHPRHRFVEHDHARIGHQRTCHLQQLALSSRQRPRHVVAL